MDQGIECPQCSHRFGVSGEAEKEDQFFYFPELPAELCVPHDVAFGG